MGGVAVEKTDLDVEKGESSTPVEIGAQLTPVEGEVKPVVKPAEEEDARTKRIRYVEKESRKKEAQLLEQQKRIQELEAVKEKSEVSAISRPSQEDFETDVAFLDAMDEYHDKRTEARLKAKSEAEAVEHQQKQASSQWDGFFDRAEKFTPERQAEIAEALKDEATPYSGTMQQIVQQSEVGPELAEHLFKNQDVAEKISKMSALQTFREMEKIAKNLIKAGSARAVSGAPTPITPLDTNGAPSSEGDPDKMSMAQWKVWRQEQRKLGR